LTDSEIERVRLHAYYTDRVVHRAGCLALLASIASAAHERHDGSGYPRGAAGGAVPLLGAGVESPHRTSNPRDVRRPTQWNYRHFGAASTRLLDPEGATGRVPSSA
jgi:hypothetical protein